MLTIKQFIAALKLKLISDIGLFFHFWSVRLDLIGVAVSGFIIAYPNAAIDAWNQFPPDLKAAIPQHWINVISIVLLVASLTARGMKQTKLESKRDEPKRTSENQ